MEKFEGWKKKTDLFTNLVLSRTCDDQQQPIVVDQLKEKEFVKDEWCVFSVHAIIVISKQTNCAS